jgi:dienelactone hydrolase
MGLRFRRSLRISGNGRMVTLVMLMPALANAQRLAVHGPGQSDQPLSIAALGLRAGQQATIRAEMRDAVGRTWSAQTTFTADGRGEIQLDRQAPDSGYDGVDAMALITSMQSLDRPALARYATKGLNPDTVRLWLTIAGRDVDSVVVERTLVATGVRIDTLAAASGLIGRLFLPPGDTRVPGVVVIGGSEGGESAADVAALLASSGMAALSLAYFGAAWLPPQLAEIPLEYFARALDFLGAHPRVKSNTLGFVGTSKGAEAALLTAAVDRRVRAVVAYAPSSVAWSCICSQQERSSWSFRGRPVASVPQLREPTPTEPPGVPTRPAVRYRARLRDSVAVAAASIVAERINGPVMLIAGGADDLWPSAEMARALRQRLAGSPGRRGDTLLVYADAGHLIGKYYLPAGSTRIAGGRIETGGTARANARAQADAWPKVVAFLQRVLND